MEERPPQAEPAVTTAPLDLPTEPVSVTPPIDPIDAYAMRPLSGTEKRQAYIMAQANLITDDLRHQREVEQTIEVAPEEGEGQDVVYLEAYNRRYFWTKTVKAVFGPTLVILGIILLTLIVVAAFTTTGHTASVGDIYGTMFLLLLVAAWWWFREFFRNWLGGVYADEDIIRVYEPRILLLGLLGKKSQFPRHEVGVEDFYPSFWNFIPGWNSWTVSLDTAAQRDAKLGELKELPDGDVLVALLGANLEPSKRRIFRRKG